MKKYLILIPFLFASGCASFSPTTSAQAIAIAQPIETGGLELVLQNNPRYNPLAAKIGADLASANYADLSVTGINAIVALAVAKEGGDPSLTAIIDAALDAGVGGYLAAVSEQSLANDPNAVAVIQAFGTGVSNAATWAAANPK